MLYNPPTGSTDPNAGYVGKNVAAGTLGSKVPPGAAEFPQREIVNLIELSGQTPTNSDLTQLTRGVRGGQLDFDATDTGTADAAVCQVGLAHTQIKAGLPFTFFKCGTPNTGAPFTLTITDQNGNNPISGTLLKNNGKAPAGGDLPANALVTVRADSSGRWRLVSLLTSSDVSNAFLLGTDTGTAGAIVVSTPLPSVSALKVGLTLVTVPAALNAGPTTIKLTTAAGVVTTPVIYPNGSPFLGGECQPRPQVYIYDGTSWEWQGQQSPVLQQATSFYVNGSTSSVTSNGITYAPGSDANNGQSAAAPFATIQKAINTVSGLNANDKQVTVNVADGTYPAFSLGTPINGSLQIVGDPVNPSACIISTAAGLPCFISNGASITLNGFRLVNASAAGNCYGLISRAGANITYLNIDFGPCPNGAHMWSDVGILQAGGNYKISGSSPYHWVSDQGTLILTPSFANTVTLTGTPAFTVFLQANDLSYARVNSNTTFSGSATGSRYQIGANSVIETAGSGTNLLPGSTAGTQGNGGIYV